LTGGLVSAGAIAAVLYLLHARRHPQPVLDFRLLRIPTFRISVTSGTLSRIAVGAMPFLLPMMLQLGFGMSAAQSGLVTFVSSVGSLLMRVAAPKLLRLLGFRNVLVWIGLVATLLLATSAGFRPGWPTILIYAVLLVGGFFQSLQFIAYNTIAYADVPRAKMSAATSFYTTFQQLSLTLGIATSAAVLGASVDWRGHAGPMLPDFSTAFLVVGAIAILAPLLSLRLRRDAGAELSGHHVRKRTQRDDAEAEAR
jgi:MFS family permease